jgi:hypothetical protein
MIRFTALAAAAVATAVLLSPIAADAQAPSGFYIATPVAKPASANIITNSTLWTWQDTAYTASHAPERANILCELVVKRVGALTSFTAGGKSFDADALAKCNARAK